MIIENQPDKNAAINTKKQNKITNAVALSLALIIQAPKKLDIIKNKTKNNVIEGLSVTDLIDLFIDEPIIELASIIPFKICVFSIIILLLILVRQSKKTR